MEDDSEIRTKEAEVAALRDEAAAIVVAASTQGRELTKEDDARVLALLSHGRSLEDEIHHLVRRQKGGQTGAR